MTKQADADSIENWDQYFLSMAALVSTKSKDPSTKVGAVIVGRDKQVLATGYNGFPRGVTDCCTEVPERYERPAKYAYTEHAERNAIYHAARSGVSLLGSTLYVQYDAPPCADCARAIVQAGITTLVTGPTPWPSPHSWAESMRAAEEILGEGGVLWIKYRGENSESTSS
jgi:dCMP deaminase